MTENESTLSETEIARVSVRVPPFWKVNPAIWFSQLESQFINAGIKTDATKYHTVVGSIETDVLAQVSDIIANPPKDNAYEVLKSRLISIFTDSEERRFKKLLQDVELGDKRPSELLRQMQNLAGDRVGEHLLKSLWLQRLPSQMQAILTTSSDELNKLAEMADKIRDVTSFSEIHSASVLKPKADTSVLSEINDLKQQISQLNLKMDKLSASYQRSRSNSRNRNQRNRSPSRNRLCWYHFRFGEKATKCLKPCSFKSENSMAGC